MSDAPGALDASFELGIQTSRVASSDDLNQRSTQHPAQELGIGVRRGYSDGDTLQQMHDRSTPIISGRSDTPNHQRVLSAESPLSNSGHGQTRHENNDSPRNDTFRNTGIDQNPQIFLRQSREATEEIRRQQAIAMLIEQRRRAQFSLREAQARRRSSTTMPSPRGPPVGLRRYAASASGGSTLRHPGNSVPPSYGSVSRDHNAQQPPNPLQRQDSRSSDYVVPKWQSDAEVSECPICHRPFSFWYRKHHCRKCGRVVCSNCSPHRITIPRQYIVHPPRGEGLILEGSGDSDEGNAAVGLSASGQLDSALGGGQEVRLCNPCVPDPNPLPPPSYTQSPTNTFTAFPTPDPPPRPHHHRAPVRHSYQTSPPFGIAHQSPNIPSQPPATDVGSRHPMPNPFTVHVGPSMYIYSPSLLM